MIQSKDKNYLINLCDEAALIVSRHDGVHNAHGAKAALDTWLILLKEKDNLNPKDWENVELMIAKLRFVDNNGYYPKNKPI